VVNGTCVTRVNDHEPTVRTYQSAFSLVYTLMIINDFSVLTARQYTATMLPYPYNSERDGCLVMERRGMRVEPG